jgi:hypothetical protein
MIPTNKDNQEGCTPISSNCVVWQGPDIPCIKLCKGDSVSDVVAKLAQELCDLLDQTNVSTYDLNCLAGICPAPQTFHDLIQILIDKICSCCDPTTEPGQVTVKAFNSDCPENCIVPIAPCFQYVNNTGDLVTTLPLIDYVKTIATRVCTLVSQIQVINITLADHESRITYIENNCCNPPTPQEIYILSSCLLGTNPPTGWLIQTVLTNLENAFCALQNATGTPAEIYTAISYQCPNLNLLESLTFPGVNMGSLPGWVLTPNSLADSITNLWITVCDMRAIITTIRDCCETKQCPAPIMFNVTPSY